MFFVSTDILCVCMRLCLFASMSFLMRLQIPSQLDIKVVAFKPGWTLPIWNGQTFEVKLTADCIEYTGEFTFDSDGDEVF